MGNTYLRWRNAATSFKWNLEPRFAEWLAPGTAEARKVVETSTTGS